MASRAALLAVFVVLFLAIFGARAQAEETPPGSLEVRLVPALAFDGENYLGSWSWEHYFLGSDRRAEFGTQGARVTPAGGVLDPVPIGITTTGSTPLDSAVAFDGKNYLVVWSTWDTVYAARVSPAGNVLDPNAIPLTSALNNQGHPAVVFDGTNYLVVWWDQRAIYSDIYGARVSPEGEVLDPDGIAIETSVAQATGPAVGFDGTNYLVIWQQDDLHGARVSREGIVLDPDGFVISAAPMHQTYSAVAFDGTNYLVVWQDERAGYHQGDPFPAEDIYGARVSPGGTVLDSQGIPIATSSSKHYAPALAFDGTNYLVAWSEGHAGSNMWDISGSRVSPEGVVLDVGGIPISAVDEIQRDTAIAFDGTNYLVAWADRRFAPSWGIYGSRVTPAGGVLDPAGIPIAIPKPLPTPPPPPPASDAKRRVPRVLGLKLTKARNRLRRAKYSIGRVRRVRSKRPGRVLRQSPRAGSRRSRGAAVNLVVGRR